MEEMWRVWELRSISRNENDWFSAVAGEVGGVELFGGEEGHLEVDGDEALGGLDEVVGLGVDDDDSVAGAVESEVGVGDSSRGFLGEEVVDGLFRSSCCDSK